MSFDISSAGSGMISGIFIAVVTALGLNKRMDKLESKLDNKVVLKETHVVVYTAIEKEIKTISDDQKVGFKSIHERLDNLFK